MTMMMLLVFVAQDRSVQITEEFIDTVIYENLAVTRVRLTVSNGADQAREFAATIRAPLDAVVFEFDGYGTVQGDNQAAFDPDSALSLYMQLVDAARRQVLNPDAAAADVDKACDDLVKKTFQRAGALDAGTVTTTVTFSNTDMGVAMQDHGEDVSQTTQTPREPELLQQVGPGEFQVVVFPIPARSKQHVEIYFASKAAPDGADAYTWEMPTELRSLEAPAERLIHVRVVSEGEVKELACPSHKTARKEDHTGKNRREVRISGRAALGSEPVKVRYVLGDGAKPAELTAFDGAEPEWPAWDKKKSADPVTAPSRAYAALKTMHRVETLMADKTSPQFDREKTATGWTTEAKLVTPYSSLILSEAVLYKFIGADVPPGKETPYKSVK